MVTFINSIEREPEPPPVWYDWVDNIRRYENDELDEMEQLDLFEYLRLALKKSAEQLKQQKEAA